METGTIVIIAIVVVVIIGGTAIAARFSILPATRTNRLRKRFGPEYDRALEAHSDKEAAEKDLSERLSHRENIQLRALTDDERAVHTDTWTKVQQQFVDDPVSAVQDARALTDAVMKDIGYPDRPSAADGGADDESFEQRAKDLSVDHPSAVDRYRRAQAAGHLDQADRTATEELREALLAYRGLLDSLMGELPGDNGSRRPGKHQRAPEED